MGHTNLEAGVVEADEDGVVVVEVGRVGLVAVREAGGEEEDVVRADISVRTFVSQSDPCNQRSRKHLPVGKPRGVHQMDGIDEFLCELETDSKV